MDIDDFVLRGPVFAISTRNASPRLPVPASYPERLHHGVTKHFFPIVKQSVSASEPARVL